MGARPVVILALLVFSSSLLLGCATRVPPRYPHVIAPFDDPVATIEFSSTQPGELEPLWTGDSDLSCLTTASYKLYIDVGMRSWVDHTREPEYSVEPITLLGHDGELLRYRYTYSHNNEQVYRANIRWRGLAIRVWADADTQEGRESAIETARTLRWGPKT